MPTQVTTLQDFNPRSARRLFRWSLGKTLIPTLVFTLLTIASFGELLGLTSFTQIPTAPLLIAGAGFALCAWVAWAQTKAGIGKNALVAALDHSNLWVRIRSPLNRHIGSEQDNFLVALPTADIEWSQLVNKKTIKMANNKPQTKSEVFLDLALSENHIEELKSLLNQERTRRKAAGQATLHFPLQVLEDGRVRIDCYNLSGGSEALQNSLPPSVEKRETRAEVKDLR